MLSAKGFFALELLRSAKLNLTKLDRKQDLNVRYQVSVLWVDQKTKMWQRMWHIAVRCMICGPLGLLFSFIVYNSDSQ